MNDKESKLLVDSAKLGWLDRLSVTTEQFEDGIAKIRKSQEEFRNAQVSSEPEVSSDDEYDFDGYGSISQSDLDFINQCSI